MASPLAVHTHRMRIIRQEWELEINPSNKTQTALITALKTECVRFQAQLKSRRMCPEIWSLTEMNKVQLLSLNLIEPTPRVVVSRKRKI